jgi:hypothetical protein
MLADEVDEMLLDDGCEDCSDSFHAVVADSPPASPSQIRFALNGSSSSSPTAAKSPAATATTATTTAASTATTAGAAPVLSMIKQRQAAIASSSSTANTPSASPSPTGSVSRTRSASPPVSNTVTAASHVAKAPRSLEDSYAAARSPAARRSTRGGGASTAVARPNVPSPRARSSRADSASADAAGGIGLWSDAPLRGHEERWSAGDARWWPWLYEVIIAQWCAVLEEIGSSSDGDTPQQQDTAAAGQQYYSGESGANLRLLTQRCVLLVSNTVSVCCSATSIARLRMVYKQYDL